MATGIPGHPSGFRELDLAIFPGIRTHSSCRFSLERMTIGRLTLARVVAAAAVLRSSAKSPGTFAVEKSRMASSRARNR